MNTNLNQPISELTKEKLAAIKIICFDSDGVTAEKGTEFSYDGIKTHVVTEEMQRLLSELKKYYFVNITSGRGLEFIKNRYQKLIGDNFSLQAEIGNFTFRNDKTEVEEWTEYEDSKIKNIREKLEILLPKEKDFLGFEPKEKIITVHARGQIEKVDEVVKAEDIEEKLYCWWNGEAYDIGPKRINKGTTIIKLVDSLGLLMSQVMTVGNGINDNNMRDIVGIDVSTDPKHLKADYFVEGEHLGGEILIKKLLQLIV